MPANPTPVLTADDTARMVAAEAAFTRYAGEPVYVTYRKRDGQVATMLGIAGDVVGGAGKRTGVVLTANGYRSANLWTALVDAAWVCEDCGDYFAVDPARCDRAIHCHECVCYSHHADR